MNLDENTGTIKYLCKPQQLLPDRLWGGGGSLFEFIRLHQKKETRVVNLYTPL